MPFAVYVLALAVFAMGMSEFMLSGLVPDIAVELGVSIPASGSLISAFAVGMVVGAPVVAVLSLRWPRRAALLAFLVTFLVMHVVGAITDSFTVLLATRVVAALANAGFLAVGIAAAAGMVGANAKGRATAVLVGGVTIACVAGVPAGAYLGELWGWRSAFWAVAVLSAPPFVAILRSVPGAAPDRNAPSALHELRAMRSPRLIVVLVLGALVNGATFCSFAYLAPVVTEVAGLPSGWVPLALLLFGLGSFAGVTLGGRYADTNPTALLGLGGIGLLIGWLVFATTAGDPVAAFVCTVVQGTLSFAVGSTLISQALYAASGAPTLAGGFATAALNVGAAAGPALGGAAIGAGAGFRSPLLVSAALVAAALLVGGIALLSARTRSGVSTG
ncbi:Cmx/CmrA family chloramphenicol efflux MFS transporter [Actinokineospora sp. UTMC 2448]|uniref:Cmx/CmrA family chloramphenicol efflux MFS transporter n=1 Tax=Actinokineospora sp. UTMC 2448 TaxID=2268449 RepID=UPI002164082B|nr:Cmx/CmrA family chloramphenicol efflux MFS transporter [Actinokineospora sp. UTMC 2448]UVS79207.1 Inner membrane transport protein YdhP [Actinokineospora sp. UTMC 2448]